MESSRADQRLSGKRTRQSRDSSDTWELLFNWLKVVGSREWPSTSLRPCELKVSKVFIYRNLSPQYKWPKKISNCAHTPFTLLYSVTVPFVFILSSSFHFSLSNLTVGTSTLKIPFNIYFVDNAVIYRWVWAPFRTVLPIYCSTHLEWTPPTTPTILFLHIMHRL